MSHSPCPTALSLLTSRDIPRLLHRGAQSSGGVWADPLSQPLRETGWQGLEVGSSVHSQGARNNQLSACLKWAFAFRPLMTMWFEFQKFNLWAPSQGVEGCRVESRMEAQGPGSVHTPEAEWGRRGDLLYPPHGPHPSAPEPSCKFRSKG